MFCKTAQGYFFVKDIDAKWEGFEYLQKLCSMEYTRQLDCSHVELLCSLSYRLLLILALISLSPYRYRESLVGTLLPSDTAWWRRSGSPLAQVIARCLTGPSHYRIQYLLITNEVFGIHLKEISQEMLLKSVLDMRFWIDTSRLHPHFPGLNEVKIWRTPTRANGRHFADSTN